MIFYLIVATTVLNHIAFKGSKVLVSLYALELGANPLSVGLLFSLYSLFPLFLAFYAGRIADRFGARWPMLVGSLGLACGLLLPYLLPRLPALYVSATVIGAFYIFYTVSAQHLIGAFGGAQQRTRNFSIYSLGIGLTALLGPTLSGFSIDLAGHRYTYLLLGLLPVAPIVFLLFVRGLPKGTAAPPHEQHRAMDLVRNVPLRRVLITAGIIETGLELFNFYLPIYGHSIGLSASMIGIIMGAFASAMLLVRSLIPTLTKRTSEEAVLYGSLSLAAAACLVFPFITNVYLLMTMSFVLGLGLGCCSPLSLIITYNRAPEGRAGEAMGMRQAVTKFTEVMVPIAFGTVGAAFGLAPAFWMDAFLLAGGAWIMKVDARARTPTRPSG
jgi:MFS family permease